MADREKGSETIVVIGAAGPREMAWLKTSAYDLTKREREVVDLVVRGASTGQISPSFYISEYTLQEHLSNGFEKVGERERRALSNASTSRAYPKASRSRLPYRALRPGNR